MGRHSPNFRCGCPKLDNTMRSGGKPRCHRCYREYQNTYAREHPRSTLRQEVAPKPLPIADTSGRSYLLAPFYGGRSA